MTVCYICVGDGVTTTTAGGFCADCNSFVCRKPSSRPDKVVHAYRCKCGACGKLICEADVLPHSSGQHAAAALPPPCFPDFTLAVAPQAGTSAVELLSGVTTIEATGQQLYNNVGRLLRVVAPGAKALYSAMVPPGYLFENPQKGQRVEELQLLPAFYTEQRLRKSIAIAARMIGETFLRAPEYGAPVQATLRSLVGSSPAEDINAAVAAVLASWLPAEMEIPDPLAIPITPNALARWLLREDKSSTAEYAEDPESIPFTSYANLYSGSES